MSSMRILLSPLILTFLAWTPSYGQGQCKGLKSSELKRLARFSFDKKVKMLREKQAKIVAIKSDSLKCEYRTTALCKNYISDQEWHWGEVLTFNSCDQILTYSTADSLHYHKVMAQLTRRGTYIGERTYASVDYKIYQLANKRVLELNKHRNKEGKTFYMLNLLKE